jgi:hypothetical protein
MIVALIRAGQAEQIGSEPLVHNANSCVEVILFSQKNSQLGVDKGLGGSYHSFLSRLISHATCAKTGDPKS